MTEQWKPTPEQIALLYSNAGFASNALGEKQKALDYYEQALVRMRAVGDRGGEGTTLNNLGRVYDDLGEKQEALRYYKQALIIHRAVRNPLMEGITVTNIGTLYYEKQNYASALAHFLVANNIFVKIQSPNSNAVQGWIDGLQRKAGEEHFLQLLAQVEPRAQQIVDEALSKH